MTSSFDQIPAKAATAEIHPVKSFGGTVRLPGSKSLTNRALLVAGLASGRSVLRNALDCDDSRHMVGALGKLGINVEVLRERAGAVPSDARMIQIDGCGGDFPQKSASFDLGNAGTATRFLTAALTTVGGEFLVDGNERMRQRPIGQLVDALCTMGAEVEAPSGCPPVRIGPRKLHGGAVNISGGTSSQFLSAILMAAPLAQQRVKLRVEGSLVSSPYVDMTLRVMEDFGAKAFRDDRRADGQPVFEVVVGRGYRGRDHFVEGDASTASYFYAAAAITGDTVRVEGVGKESMQGDLRAADVFAEMGCRVKKESDAVTVTGAGGLLRGVDCDCSDIPDVVPTLAVVGAFARGHMRIRGVPHLRYKESDRIASVASELTKLGAKVEERKDGLVVEGSLGVESLHGASIDSWGDHRIAMALGIAGLLVPGVSVQAPQVVSKSFPGFFHSLRRIGARVTFRDARGDEIVVDEGSE